MNVLMTSISKKVPFIQAVKKALNRYNPNAILFGGDVNNRCIGQYFVDDFWHMMPLEELPMVRLINYCKKNNINVIIPTRDAELLFFSKHQSILNDNDIYVMVSNASSIERISNKVDFYTTYGQIMGYPIISSSLSIEDLSCDTYVVKECYGAGSQNIALDVTKEDAVIHSLQLSFPLYQPFIEGEEYSIDVYVDKFGKSKGSIARKRNLVINGESQITTTVTNKNLEDLAAEMAEAFKLYGHVMFQVIVDCKENPHVIECNPRFGGASTLSVEAGLDSFYWFFLESHGDNLSNYPFIRSKKELKLIRHSEDLII